MFFIFFLNSKLSFSLHSLKIYLKNKKLLFSLESLKYFSKGLTLFINCNYLQAFIVSIFSAYSTCKLYLIIQQKNKTFLNCN